MTNRDWVQRAKEFIQIDPQHWSTTQTQAERRIAVIDIHSAIEDTIRWYLESEHNYPQAVDKSTTNFPTILSLLRHATHSRILEEAQQERLLYYNSLRNCVAHEGHIPQSHEIEEFAQIGISIIERTLRMSGVKPAQIKGGRSGASRVASTASTVMTVLAGLYWILPDILPFNPIDDIIIGVPCLSIAFILYLLAQYLANRE